MSPTDRLNWHLSYEEWADLREEVSAIHQKVQVRLAVVETYLRILGVAILAIIPAVIFQVGNHLWKTH